MHMGIDMKHVWNKDCKSFPGVYACDILKSECYTSCEDCKFYSKITKKIIIIKLGALGDVLRTTPLLSAIKKKFSYNCHITWIVDESNKEVLKNNNNVGRILTFNASTILQLQQEKFDVLYSLDITVPTTTLANLIKAKRKYGYYYDKDGNPNTFNKSAEYYLEKAWSDKLKLENRKTYQEMIFEICEFPFNKEDYVLNLTNLNYQEEFLKRNKLEKNNIIGINIGAGSRWKSKSWGTENYITLIEGVLKDSKVLVLGGPEEIETFKEIKRNIKDNNLFFNDPNNTILEFASIIDICNLIITNDTLALHLALALKKKTIALFFCTSPFEVEAYGRLTKIISPLLDKNFYSDEYDKDLVNSIKPENIINVVKDLS